MRRFSILLALCAGSVLVACGGGTDDPAASGSDTTADPVQAYREEVNRACLDASLDRDLVPNPGGSGSEDLASYLKAMLSDARKSERRLAAISAPPPVAEQHREGRRLGREAIGLVDRAARAARRGEEPDVVLRRLEPAVNRRIVAGNRIAEKLGTSQCRQEPLALGFEGLAE